MIQRLTCSKLYVNWVSAVNLPLVNSMPILLCSQGIITCNNNMCNRREGLRIVVIVTCHYPLTAYMNYNSSIVVA